MKIGQIIFGKENLILNKGKKSIALLVKNTSNRPIQISSHYHFYEVNRELSFDRDKSFGMRLDVPSGEAVRFEPGEEKIVNLVEFSGQKRIMSFNGLTNGQATERNLCQARKKAQEKGYKGV